MAMQTNTTPTPTEEFRGPSPRLAEMAARPENKNRPLLEVADDLRRLELAEARAKKLAAIHELHSYDDPAVFAHAQARTLRALLAVMADCADEIDDADVPELRWLAADLARQIDVALELHEGHKFDGPAKLYGATTPGGSAA